MAETYKERSMRGGGGVFSHICIPYIPGINAFVFKFSRITHGRVTDIRIL